MVYFREKAKGIAMLFSQKKRVSKGACFREEAKGIACFLAKK